MNENPFAALGLEGRPSLSGEDVRAAWRRVAAATHPDREDGGDPARYSAAAAAYEALRTAYGRGEALAGPADNRGAGGPAWWRSLGAVLTGAAGVSAGAFAVAGWSPGTAGVLAGALTWVTLAAARARDRDRDRAG
jgi:hypothetical protein